MKDMKMRLCFGAVVALLCALPLAAQSYKPKVLTVVGESKIDNGRHTIFSVAFTPDGKTLAVGEDNVHLYDVSGDEPQRLAEFKTRVAFGVHGMAFSPDGKYLAMGGGDHTVRVWDIGERKETFKSNAHGGDVRSAAFDPVGKILASGSDDKSIVLWDFDGGKLTERTALRAA